MGRVTITRCAVLLAIVSLGIVLSFMAPNAAESATLWPATTVPGMVDAGPDGPVQLGVKFASEAGGYITGIRFYKAEMNTGPHVGSLWTSTGTLLATATFTNETASGWQQVTFPQPVAISAGTDYVASYHSTAGHYSFDRGYFSGRGVDTPPLHSPPDGLTGGNGLYAYGDATSFPSQTWGSANYWVDVEFSPLVPLTAPDGGGTLWPASTVPGIADAGADTPVELGVKFRSEAGGYITGIRFYKGSGNTGPHTGNLWTASGSRLATATFTNETASGWQQANFATPVAISSGTVYIASYHTTVGHYGFDRSYFAGRSVDAPPLHALAEGENGGNGVYAYGAAGTFPSQSWGSTNYWVDLVFSRSATADATPPTITSFTLQAATTMLTVAIGSFTATDNVGVTGFLITESAVTPAAGAAGWSASPPASYTFATAGAKTLYAWARDAAGNVSAAASAPVTVTLPEGGPILIVTSPANPFSGYYAEIVRTEGFNAFAVNDLASVTAGTLAGYDLVILGETPLTTEQAAMFEGYVASGGHLIAMRPDKKLAGIFGVNDLGSAISDAYLAINGASGAGTGLVTETIQYHGAADLYSLGTAARLATLYSNSTTATSSPAVTLNSVGTQGGQAAAFTFDLARSVIYTRQGNPAWAGQPRDGRLPVRSDDLFYGNASFDPQPDWVDLNKIAIPQADELQRLLANLIIQMNTDKKPLPRFWYFPRAQAAVVVMTGDDHGWGVAGTAGRFDTYLARSPSGCNVENWECIRSTSYVFPTAAVLLSDAKAAAYAATGFEVALHVNTGDGSADPATGCADWTPSSLDRTVATQVTTFSQKFPSLKRPATNRSHCVAWSDFASKPLVELSHGIRLDTTYYFYPPGWVGNRPGFFTGSGVPMRFAGNNGALIDVYQAPTQMTDESGQSYPATIDTLLDRAFGAEGYYGAFVANMHTDIPDSPESDAIVASAIRRGVPVVSARQMLEWLDGRNASSFRGISWSGNTLSFAINKAPGATGLTVMTPIPPGRTVTAVSLNGVSLPVTTTRIKGVQYVHFTAMEGSCQITYAGATDVTPPTVTSFTLPGSATGLTVPVTSFAAIDDVGVSGYLITESAAPPTVAAPWSVTPPTSYSFATAGGKTLYAWARDAAGNVSPAKTAGITIGTGTTASLWSSSTLPDVADAGADSGVELGVRFRSDSDGFITGIRFYKGGAGNCGPHMGHLWASDGRLLATITFTGESDSGWQQALFSSPVAVTANSYYIASYHTPAGHFSYSRGYFAGKGVDTPPLHAPADGVAGFNGVYAYGPAGTFPSQGWNSFNYWVDVVFQQ